MGSGIWIVVAAAVGAGSGFVGSALERRFRRRDERAAAAAAWLAAVDTLAATFAGLPELPDAEKSGRVSRYLDSAAEWLERAIGPYTTHAIRSWFFWPLTHRLERLVDAFWIANARLVLSAPAELLTELQPLTLLIAQWAEKPGDSKILAQWDEKRAAAVTALRRL